MYLKKIINVIFSGYKFLSCYPWFNEINNNRLRLRNHTKERVYLQQESNMWDADSILFGCTIFLTFPKRSFTNSTTEAAFIGKGLTYLFKECIFSLGYMHMYISIWINIHYKYMHSHEQKYVCIYFYINIHKYI